jgi:hypothetical protein
VVGTALALVAMIGPAPVCHHHRQGTPAWSITEWVAVVSVAAGAEELAGDVERLVERCPEEAVLARVGAHEGLAEALGVDPGWWYCGVAAADRARVDEARTMLGRVFGRPPRALGAFRLLRLVD